MILSTKQALALGVTIYVGLATAIIGAVSWQAANPVCTPVLCPQNYVSQTK